jgi:hypothetical protein
MAAHLLIDWLDVAAWVGLVAGAAVTCVIAYYVFEYVIPD